MTQYLSYSLLAFRQPVPAAACPFVSVAVTHDIISISGIAATPGSRSYICRQLSIGPSRSRRIETVGVQQCWQAGSMRGMTLRTAEAVRPSRVSITIMSDTGGGCTGIVPTTIFG